MNAIRSAAKQALNQARGNEEREKKKIISSSSTQNRWSTRCVHHDRRVLLISDLRLTESEVIFILAPFFSRSVLSHSLLLRTSLRMTKSVEKRSRDFRSVARSSVRQEGSGFLFNIFGLIREKRRLPSKSGRAAPSKSQCGKPTRGLHTHYMTIS